MDPPMGSVRWDTFFPSQEPSISFHSSLVEPPIWRQYLCSIGSGWTNSFEKYSSNCIISLGRGENNKYVKPPSRLKPPVIKQVDYHHLNLLKIGRCLNSSPRPKTWFHAAAAKKRETVFGSTSVFGILTLGVWKKRTTKTNKSKQPNKQTNPNNQTNKQTNKQN